MSDTTTPPPAASDTSLILDFETLSTDPGAIVIEIGCIAVKRADFTAFASLDLRPKILPQFAAGRTYSTHTIRWHESKGTLPTQLGEIDLKDAVRKLARFIEDHNPHRIWAWGKDFERPLFENLCAAFDIEVPHYQFRKFACARDQWQNAMDNIQPPERTHHAIEDCQAELLDLHRALKATHLTHVF